MPRPPNIPQRKPTAFKKTATVTVQGNPLAKLFDQGLALHQKGQYQKAKLIYEQILAKDPQHFDALHLLGVVARQTSNPAKAVELIKQAVAINSRNHFAYSNLGNAYRDLEQFDLAVASYSRAIELKPDYAQAYYSRGDALKQLKQLEEAVTSYDLAITHKPDYADAYCNRANTLYELKRLDEALISYKKAIDLGFEFLYGHWLNSIMMLCDWSSLDDQIAELISRIERHERQTTAFTILSVSDSPSVQREAAQIWINARRQEKKLLGVIPKRTKKEKIRLAYYSMDYWNHPVAFLTAELFELHDRNQFEVIAFSYGQPRSDSMRQRLLGAFDQFIDVQHLSDMEIAKLSREMQIDIAIDLAGHTRDSRTGIFSYRAAPIQISYLGYPGTMSASYIDYILADDVLIPPQSVGHYSEKIVYLPSYQVNDRKRAISDKVFTRQELGLPEQGMVYCCFNNNYKILPATFNSWMNILKAVEGSVLFLYADLELTQQNLRKEAINRGVDPKRLIFGKRLMADEYLARYKAADLFLDTLPFNAGTTGSDALWAGLPVLTLLGNTFAGRYAASLLTAIGLPELITKTQAEYEALAIELGKNPEKLAAIKGRLAQNRHTTPLFDTPLFTKHLEAAYTQMMERYWADLPPDHIKIDS